MFSLLARAQASRLSREQEADRILKHYGPDALPDIMLMLERQFTVLHNRSQVLLALGGIIISTTGISGRNIASTGVWAQGLVIGGLSCVLLSSAVVCWGVLHLRWLSMQNGPATREWLITSLTYRDHKTNKLRVGLIIMLIGIAFYVAAVIILLAHPASGNNYISGMR
jgi:hypothetical protein